jgi:uncharacterized radical SAM superfamily Fe-S cluster-containing enzyme
MICPTCKGVFRAAEWKNTITYECNEHCTKLLYEDGELKSYVLSQKIEDEKNPNLRYRLLSMKSLTRPTTTLFIFDSSPNHVSNKLILTLNHFVNVTTQKELDGLINRLLNLKAFS